MSVQLYLVVFSVVSILVSVFSIISTFMIKKREFQKKIKLDVTREQMLKSEQRINDFLIDHNIKAEEAVSEIARILNVEEGGNESSLESQAYLKESDATGKKIVVFKDGLSEKEKRFVFAHEIAHLLNGDRVPVTRPNGCNKSEIEQLADYTAAALLMPLEEVYNYLLEKEYAKVSARKRVAIVHDLCKEYNVTEMIALRRVKEIYVLKQLNN